ncbi:hypothetical protein C9F11_39390 [Streptomyces sp. YIM 121038]|uniref:hypothetical protein n=1 Tax=Streptomyces sp. YIM 121038 TaxID=2136401 RepID=UPI001110A3D3|nr:hypothetical protein [Streptomyces sp. YIM 121038]QCX81460.1 hypothetical protein C9F11_39390 [Streptomyces sp. YIM 121038]
MTLMRLTLDTVYLFEEEEAGSTRMGLYVRVLDNSGNQVAEFRWNRRNGEVEDNFQYPLDGDQEYPSVLVFDIGGVPGGIGRLHVKAYTDNDERWPDEGHHENFLGEAEVVFDTREPSQLGQVLLGPTTTDNGHTGYAVTGVLEAVPPHVFRQLRLVFRDVVVFDDENSDFTHMGLYVRAFAPAQGGAEAIDQELLRWNNGGDRVFDEALFPLASGLPSPVTTLAVGGPTRIWVEAYTHDDEAWPSGGAYENFLGRAMITIDPNEPDTLGRHVLGPTQTDQTHNGFLLTMSSELLPPDATPNLEITGVEVTQATQHFTPPTGGPQHALAAGKATLVRVYLDSGIDPREGGTVDGVVGTLTLNGGSFTTRSLNPITARPIAQVDRGQIAHTLNFLIPADRVTAGTAKIQVQAEVAGTLSNPMEVTADFRATRPVTVWMVRVSTPAVPALTPARYRAVADLLPLRYPIADTGGIVYYTVPGLTEIHTTRDLASEDGQGDFIDDLEDIQEDHGNDDQLLYAMLDHAVPLGKIGGLARYNDHVSFGYEDAITFAHEVGHLLGLRHAPCGGPENVDEDFTPPDGRTGEVGAGPLTPTPILHPATTGDLMSYCDVRSSWIGGYHWLRLLNTLSVRGEQADAAPPERPVHGTVPAALTTTSRPFPGQYVRVRGRVSRSGAVRWQPCLRTFRKPSPPRTVPGPVYTVSVEDAAGQVLASAPTAVVFDRHEQQEAAFGARLPYAARAHRVVLRRDGTELGALVVPSGAPQFILNTPLSTPEIDTEGVLHLRWQRLDVGEPEPRPAFTYFVRFTNADGTFAPRPGVSLSGTSFDLDLRTMPGHERCVAQVIATNGYHTSYVQTPAFALPPRPPEVLLGAVEGPLLNAQGSSPQHGPITGADVAWLVDGRAAATGVSFDVRSTGSGAHAIAVRITDRDGLDITAPLGTYDGTSGQRLPVPPAQ